jgi:hypothetical protein
MSAQLILADAENTFDLIGIAHAQLNMRFRMKSSSRVQRHSFDEYACNSVNSLQAFGFGDVVEHCCDGTVELAKPKVVPAAVFGKLDASFPGCLERGLVGGPHMIDPSVGVGGKIETEPRVNYRPNDHGLPSRRISLPFFASELKSSRQIAL